MRCLAASAGRASALRALPGRASSCACRSRRRCAWASPPTASSGPAPSAIVTPAGIAGESELAEELRSLRRHLRWDAEEELSRLVGDVAAHRIALTVKALLGWPRDSARRLAEAAADFAVDERRALVRRGELAPLA